MPTDDSAAERNKKIIRRVFDEFVNKGVFSVVDEIYREDMIDHQPLPGAPRAGRASNTPSRGCVRVFPICTSPSRT